MSDKLDRIHDDPSAITRFTNRTDEMVQIAVSKDPSLLGKLAHTKKGLTPSQFRWAVQNTAYLLSPSSGAFEAKFFGLPDNDRCGFDWNLALTNDFLEGFQAIRPIECRDRWAFGSTGSDLIQKGVAGGRRFGFNVSLPEVVLDQTDVLPKGYLEKLLSFPEMASFIRAHPDFPKSDTPLEAVQAVEWRDLPLTPATRLNLAMINLSKFSEPADQAAVDAFRALIRDFRDSTTDPFIATGFHHIETLLKTEPGLGAELLNALIDQDCLPLRHGSGFIDAFDSIPGRQKDRFFSLAADHVSSKTIIELLDIAKKGKNADASLPWLSPEVSRKLCQRCEQEGMLDSLVYHLPGRMMVGDVGVKTFRTDCSTLKDLPPEVVYQLSESDLCESDGILLSAISSLRPDQYERLIEKDTGPLRSRLAAEGGKRNSGSNVSDKEAQVLIDIGLGPKDVLLFAHSGRHDGAPMRLRDSTPMKQLFLGLTREELAILSDQGADLRVDASLLSRIPADAAVEFVRKGAFDIGADDVGFGRAHLMAYFEFVASGMAVANGPYRHRFDCELSPQAFDEQLLTMGANVKLPPNALTIKWPGDSLRSLNNAVSLEQVRSYAERFGISDLWPPSVFKSRPYLEETLKGLTKHKGNPFHTAIRLLSKTSGSGLLRQIQEESEDLVLDAIGEVIADGRIPKEACDDLDYDRITAGWRARQLTRKAESTPAQPAQKRQKTI